MSRIFPTGHLRPYRCYILNKADGISCGTTIDAEDDAGAFTAAADQLRVSELYPAIEIWQGSRLVGRVSQRDGKD